MSSSCIEIITHPSTHFIAPLKFKQKFFLNLFFARYPKKKIPLFPLDRMPLRPNSNFMFKEVLKISEWNFSDSLLSSFCRFAAISIRLAFNGWRSLEYYLFLIFFLRLGDYMKSNKLNLCNVVNRLVVTQLMFPTNHNMFN